LIQVKDRFCRFQFAREQPDAGCSGRDTWNRRKSRSRRYRSRFSSLVGAGYVAVALAYYFMFNHANLQL
jgi:hypothetical protein